MKIAGLIVAAGSGTRFGNREKILAPVAGKPMLQWSLEAFASSGMIAETVVVAASHTLEPVAELMAPYPRMRAITGGTERWQSVQNGLRALSESIEIVVIHDAARPLITVESIEATAQEARRTGAAILASAVTDTLKRVGDDHLIQATVNRTQLWHAQTPQAYKVDTLLAAFAAHDGSQITDEAMLFEQQGIPVSVVQGSRLNIKVTLPEDLDLADLLLRHRLDQI